MNIPPLCIIQARMNSYRLPGKMLLPLNGETMIKRAWRIAATTFGFEHCVVAIPEQDLAGPLGDELRMMGASIFAFIGDETDVLSRFHVCAYTYRWHPNSVIVRYTPDDPFKSSKMLCRVAEGERLPVEQGGEAFSLAQIDVAHMMTPAGSREHLTNVFFGDIVPPPPPPAPHPWTIDTHDQYQAAIHYIERQKTRDLSNIQLDEFRQTSCRVDP